MYFERSLSAALALLCLVQQSSALGINCRGSGLCPLAGFENDGDEGILQGLRDAMYSVDNATVPGTTTYHDGDHVICVSSSIKISISAGVSVKGVSAKVGLNGKLGIGGVCAFAQSTGAGGITLDRARQLMDGLLDHGCKVCGSNPTQPGNDVKTGELTVNYVKNPSCTGNCLGAGAGLNPTAGKDQTSSLVPEPATSASPSSAAAAQTATLATSSTAEATTADSSGSAVSTGLKATLSVTSAQGSASAIPISTSHKNAGPSQSAPAYSGPESASPTLMSGNATTLSTRIRSKSTADYPASQHQQSYTVVPYIAYTTIAL